MLERYINLLNLKMIDNYSFESNSNLILIRDCLLGFAFILGLTNVNFNLLIIVH